MNEQERRIGEEPGAAGYSVAVADVWAFPSNHDPAVDLVGFSVEATDGGIGKVDRATYETTRSYIVVDTGPWIFGKKVLLPAGVIQDIDLDGETIYVDRTKDEIKNAPQYVAERETTDDYRLSVGDYYRR